MDNLLKAVDAFVDLLNFVEEALCFLSWNQSTADAIEQAEAQLVLGVVQHAAKAWLRNIQQPRCTTNGFCDHHSTEDFNLTKI